MEGSRNTDLTNGRELWSSYTGAERIKINFRIHRKVAQIVQRLFQRSSDDKGPWGWRKKVAFQESSLDMVLCPVRFTIFFFLLG